MSRQHQHKPKPEQASGRSPNFEPITSAQRYRIPILEYNRLTGETNIMQFARSLKKYSEQELPALGSGVSRFKANTIAKPKPPILVGNQETKNLTLTVQALAKTVEALVEISHPQIPQSSKPPSEPKETGRKGKGKSKTTPPVIPAAEAQKATEPGQTLNLGNDKDDDDLNDEDDDGEDDGSTKFSDNDEIEEESVQEESDGEATEDDEGDDPELSDPMIPDSVKLANYAARMEIHLQKKSIFDSENSILFGTISSQLSISSKELVEGHSKYSSTRRFRDGIALWKLVYELHRKGPTHLTLDQQRDAALSKYYNLYQRNQQDLNSYYQDFQDHISFLKAIGIKANKKETISRFINSLNRENNGELHNHINNNPITTIQTFNSLNDAYNYVSNYRSNHRSNPENLRGVYLANRGRGNGRGGRGRGRADPRPKRLPESKEEKAEQPGKYCSFHKSTTHSDRECYAQKKSTKTNGNVSDESMEYDEYQNPNLVVLDSGAQISIFNNKKILTDVHEVPKILLSGVNKNAKPIRCALAGHLPSLPKVPIYYSPESKKNLLKYSDLHKFYPIQWDPEQNIFSVYDNEGNLIEFHQKFDIYCRVFETNNEIFYTNLSSKDINKAKLARDISNRLACESDSGLMKILRKGCINNMPITYRDIVNAKALYGPEISHIKGKSVNSPITLPPIENISKHQEKIQTLIIDIMYVNREAFLLTVSRPLDLITSDHLPSYGSQESKSRVVVKAAIFLILGTYRAEGFHINEIICDKESTFVSIEPDINQYGAKLSYTISSSHSTAIIDRKIRFIKERARSLLHFIKFPLPNIFLKWLIYFVVSRINLTPHGDSSISPRESFIGRRTDYYVDLRIGFGEFCQVLKHSTDNSMNSRTEDCISLLPTGKQNGSVIFYSFSTGRTITHNRWTSLPMPDIILKTLQSMCLQEKQIPKSIPFNYRGKLIEDSSIQNPTPVLRPLSEEYKTITSMAPTVDFFQPLEPTDLIGRVVQKSNDFEEGEDPDAITYEERYNSDTAQEEPIYSPIEVPTSNAPMNIETSDVTSDPIVSDATPETSNVPAIPIPELLNQTPKSRYGRNIKPVKIFEVNFVTEILFDIFNITVEDAMKSYGEKAKESIKKELTQMLKKCVWHPVHTHLITGKRIIPSKMFLKQKLDVLKARLVAGGHLQIRTTENFSSPTAHIFSIFILALIIAIFDLEVATLDITGAYLNATMTSEVYMRISATLSSILIEIDPTYQEFLSRNNSIVVRLDKALYGCIESAKLWYEDIKNFLLTNGFTTSTLDECIFVKFLPDDTIYIALFVDDFKIAAKRIENIQLLESQLREKYKELTIKYGKIHQYLGMVFDYSVPGKVKISMEDYITKLLNFYNISETSTTPHDSNLFEEEDLPLLPEAEQSFLHSGTAQLLYLSGRVRPDISLPVNYLCTRVKKFTQSDKLKFYKILHYLNSTKFIHLNLECSQQNISIDAFADASYGISANRKSQSGHVIMIGKGSILAQSIKQKIVTKSSTEAELVSASDIISPIQQIRSLLQDFRIPIKGVRLHQDNMSTIKLIINKKPTSHRSKHIDIRYFFLRDRSISDGLEIVYTPTDSMVADLLTKPLKENQFKLLRDIIMNHHEEETKEN